MQYRLTDETPGVGWCRVSYAILRSRILGINDALRNAVVIDGWFSVSGLGFKVYGFEWWYN